MADAILRRLHHRKCRSATTTQSCWKEICLELYEVAVTMLEELCFETPNCLWLRCLEARNDERSSAGLFVVNGIRVMARQYFLMLWLFQRLRSSHVVACLPSYAMRFTELIGHCRDFFDNSYCLRSIVCFVALVQNCKTIRHLPNEFITQQPLRCKNKLTRKKTLMFCHSGKKARSRRKAKQTKQPSNLTMIGARSGGRKDGTRYRRTSRRMMHVS